MGYRYYEAMGITPAFPFGHGLSYTTFEYSEAVFTPVMDDSSEYVGSVSFELRNTGSIYGDEVAQLYVTFPSKAGEPPNQLKAFAKVGLNAESSTKVTFDLKKTLLSIWNSNSHSWELVHGVFVAKCGGSSRDAAAAQFSFEL